MINVKLFGLLRLETGIKELPVTASTVKDALKCLENAGISKENLAGCVIFVNNQPARKHTKLRDGDCVILMPPVAGG